MLSFSKLSRIYSINNLKSIRNCKLLTPLSFNVSKNEVQTLTTFTQEKDSDSRHKRNWHTGAAGLFISIAGFYALNSFTTIKAKENEEKNENEFTGVDTGRVSEIYEKEIEARNTKEIGRLNQRERYNFIANVVDTTAPAVVYIEIKDSRRQDFFGGTQTFSNGSGFIIKEDGLILTNAHVVIGRPHSIVQVKLQDGRVFSGQVEAVDTASDLATVRIPCNNLPTLKLGSSSSVKPGEFVVAMGSPLSLANTITSGVVSSVNRGSSELGLRGRDMEYIQTDAAITFGNSGGPLVNLDGEAIGINAMKVTAGISFAIPIDYAKEFLLTLEKQKERGTGWLGSWMGHGKDAKDQRRQAPGITKRRYMGVTLLTLTPQLILELQMRGTDLPPDVYHGVLVWKVVIGSPAHSAGLTPGDVIVTINGRAVVTAKDIYKQLEGADETLQLGVVRKRQHVTLTVRPEGSS